MKQSVGIEKIWAYPCSMSLDMEALGQARGAEPGYPSKTLLLDARSVNPCWEDPVTMAVNAATPMLSDEDRQSIELLIVGTESSPDQGKPMSTFVFRFLGLQENCRNFETKHACYGGTSAIMMAAHWVASGAAPGAKALVICTDQGRMHLGSPWEYVLGAGAVAMLISDKPDVVEFELRDNGYWTKEVGDTFRPTSREEAGNTENSVYCYLEALEGAFAHYRRKAGDAFDFDRHFARHLYHMPFGAMAYRAHRTLLRGERMAQGHARTTRQEAEEHFDRKVRPGLRFVSQVGGTYTAATSYALIGMLDASPELNPGDRLSVFSYGSGSCAEFYGVRVGAGAADNIRRLAFQQALDKRYQLSVEQYEAIEHERTSYIDKATYQPPTTGLDDLYRRHYQDQRLLVLRGLDGYFRNYDWS